MRQIQMREVGRPEEVVECVEVDAPVVSAPDDVLIAVKAFPINPADLLSMRGHYPRSDPNSPALGLEAVGIVEAVGASVTAVAAGDRVIPLAPNCWSEKLLVKEHQVVRVSAAPDLLQLAGLKVNPATAALILSIYADLQPGDWFLQNAASSSVGEAAVQIARSRGLRSINVVRRESAVTSLKALGADVVLVDGEDLVARVAAATGGAPIKLAADGVAGGATNRLASCLAPKGAVVVFGGLSGEPVSVGAGTMIIQGISLHGFWVTRYLGSAPRAEIAALYSELDRLVTEGKLVTKIDSTFDAKAIKEAVHRAGEGGRSGKVMVTFGDL